MTSTFSSCRHLITISAPVIFICFRLTKPGSRKTCNLIGKSSIGQGFTAFQPAFPPPLPAPDFLKEAPLATQRELSDFLVSVERRAFKQAAYAVRNEETALDLVQDAMMKLAEKYGDRPPEEFPMLFQRILQNGIRDHHRRHKVRSTWTTLLSALAPKDEDDYDPLDTLEVENTSKLASTPDGQLEQSQVMAIIENEIKKLPARQREAFLMRYWEDMDVAETAVAMGCSEGSVKTHCSRATHSLAAALKGKGITL